jgi:hypothetical protein
MTKVASTLLSSSMKENQSTNGFAEACQIFHHVRELYPQAILTNYAHEQEGLPPKITALLQGCQPPGEL